MAERNAEMARKYEDGASLRTLAGEYGISHQRVRDILLARGVKMRPVGVNEPPVDQSSEGF